jgi:hypothetical protein
MNGGRNGLQQTHNGLHARSTLLVRDGYLKASSCSISIVISQAASSRGNSHLHTHSACNLLLPTHGRRSSRQSQVANPRDFFRFQEYIHHLTNNIYIALLLLLPVPVTRTYIRTTQKGKSIKFLHRTSKE